MSDKAKDGWDKIDIIFKILLPVVLGIIGWLTADLARSLDEKSYEQSLKKFQADEQYRYLNTFLENFNHSDEKRKELALMLITKLDSNVASRITEEIQKKNESNSEETKALLNKISKSIDQYGDLNQFKLGIYYLKGKNDKGLQEAQKIKEQLRKDNFNGSIEIIPGDERFFKQISEPDSKFNEVRFDPDTEKNEAGILLNKLKSFPLEMEFKLQPVKSRTPNFLSIVIANPD